MYVGGTASIDRQIIAQQSPRGGKPQQSGFIESFNGTLADARHTLEEWQEDYKGRRPHSALGNLTPMKFLQRRIMDKMAA